MKFIVSILFVFSLFMSPLFVYADCSKTGTTVIFVNGIFATKESAGADKNLLERRFKSYSSLEDITFIEGFNESHLGKLDDLAASAIQAYTGGYLDHDLTDVLRQIHGDLKTQKILLVGHSQGTFYTNAAYDYLVSHGVDKGAIAVYNVATPADRVAGAGKYLNSSTDDIINLIVKDLTSIGFAKKPLPANINIEIPKDTPNPEGGHSFSSVYLGLVPDRIIGDMDEQLSGLFADRDKDECFTQPKIDTMYRVFDGGYALVDGIGKYSNYASTSPYIPRQMASIANSLFQGTYNFGKGIVSGIGQIFSKFTFFKASLASSPAYDTISGSGLSTSNPSEEQILSDTAPADTSVVDYNEIDNSAPVPIMQESLQDQLDDIQEKLDIISQQVQMLIAQQNPESQPAEVQEDKTPDDKKDQDQIDNQDDNTDNQNNNRNSGGGGVIYPKILISEVQSSGPTDDKQEFVELYNPNSQEVDLTGWYLQRKTAGASSWSTYAANSLFTGKKITSNGYFLIARSGYYSELADIFTDNPITDDNSFALKNPGGDVSDKLGFGSAEDPELVATINPDAGQSIGRRVLNNMAEQDFDNNSTDFELQNPTPRSQNITYVAPVIQQPASFLKILISEVKISEKSGDKNVFIELYNPNNTAVGLTDWYIFRNGSSLITKTMFAGKEIPANGYFLITKEGSVWDGQANVLFDGALNQDDNISLKNSNGDLTDEASWSQIATGLSLGRKWSNDINSYIDTDNDTTDFKLDNPTPKTRNIEYSAPVPSSDDTITSDIYTVSTLTSGAGTIKGVPYATSQATFRAAITAAVGASVDYSTTSALIVSGDTLVVTAQDGITKATYTVTVDTTNLYPGIIDDFTPAGKFNFHTSDFMPNQKSACRLDFMFYKDTYPNKNNWLGTSLGTCADVYPDYFMDLGAYKTPGEYDFYISYFGGNNFSGKYPIGDYYRVYFDGTVWSPIPTDNSKLRLSNDVTVTSTNYYILKPLSPTYVAGVFTNGVGTITNVRLGTSKSVFESALTFAVGSVVDFSGLTDPIATGNTIIVSSQSGTVKATYTVTVDTINWSQGAVASYTSAGKFDFDTFFLTDDPKKSCNSHLYRSIYPFESELENEQIFPCGGNNGTRPIFTFDMGGLHTVGDYTNWMADPSSGLGEYYEMHFDGSTWSPLNVVLSKDATVTSLTYLVSPLADGSGSITNVPFGTSKNTLESALTKNQTNQIWDDSGINDPVVSGNALIVTAQDGTTKATYAITVNAAPDTTPPSVANYTLNGLAQSFSFNPNTSGPVTIVINTSEPVKFNHIYICPSSAVICDGSADIKYFYQTNSYSSTVSKEWEGNASGGDVVVPDGIYEVGVQITDEAGNEINSTLSPYTITIDTTLP